MQIFLPVVFLCLCLLAEACFHTHFPQSRSACFCPAFINFGVAAFESLQWGSSSVARFAQHHAQFNASIVNRAWKSAINSKFTIRTEIAHDRTLWCLVSLTTSMILTVKHLQLLHAVCGGKRSRWQGGAGYPPWIIVGEMLMCGIFSFFWKCIC